MGPGVPVPPSRDIFPARELTDADFDRFRRLIHEAAGISLSDGKKELLKARLGKTLRTRGISSFAEYYRIIEADRTGSELTYLLDAVSTNVTSFFRENEHFRFMENELLPGLRAARGRPGDRKVRIWSAGCSTGEEPYTIAIVLRECLPEAENWDARILATDISTRVLSVAKNGLYAPDRFGTMPHALLARHFEPVESPAGEAYYRVSSPLRRMVTFARLNLHGSYPFRGPFDAIFCRNVMIYFDKPTQEELVNRYHQYLAPGGHLFIGHSESLNGVRHPFVYVRPSVYRKAGARE